MLYVGEVWCLKESEMLFFMKDRKINGERNVERGHTFLG